MYLAFKRVEYPLIFSDQIGLHKKCPVKDMWIKDRYAYIDKSVVKIRNTTIICIKNHGIVLAYVKDKILPFPIECRRSRIVLYMIRCIDFYICICLHVLGKKVLCCAQSFFLLLALIFFIKKGSMHLYPPLTSPPRLFDWQEHSITSKFYKIFYMFHNMYF